MIDLQKQTGKILAPPRARNEIHGDEIKQALDANVCIHITENASQLIEQLHVPELQLSLWDDEGNAQLEEADIRLRNALEGVDVVFSRDSFECVFRHAKLKNIGLRALTGNGVELTFKLQAQCTPKQFDAVWAFQIAGDCKVSLIERQLSIAA